MYQVTLRPIRCVSQFLPFIDSDLQPPSHTLIFIAQEAELIWHLLRNGLDELIHLFFVASARAVVEADGVRRRVGINRLFQGASHFYSF